MDIPQAINDAIAFQTKVVEAAKIDGYEQVISFHRGGLATLTSLAEHIASKDTPYPLRKASPQLSRPELLAELRRHHHELTVEEQALEIQLDQANKAMAMQQELLMDVRDQRIEMQSLIDNMMGKQQPEHEEDPLPFDCSDERDVPKWTHGLKPKVLDD